MDGKLGGELECDCLFAQDEGECIESSLWYPVELSFEPGSRSAFIFPSHL